MSSGNGKKKVFTVFFMFAITFVFISGVAIVHMVTKSTVERNRTLFEKQAVCEACGMPAPETTEALLAWYAESVIVVTNETGRPDYYRVRSAKSSGTEEFVIVTTGAGLWGQITAYVGFTADASAIKAVTFLDHVETPGLGARIDEAWFKQQFRGKQGPFTGLMPEPQDKSNPTLDDDMFDQITGATITSTAVLNIMNKSLERVRALVKAP